MVMSGPGGSKSHAIGTEGTTTNTKYQNNNVSYNDKWDFATDGNGNVKTRRKKDFK